MAHWLIVHTNGGRAVDGTRLVFERSLKEIHAASAPNGYALGWDTDGPAGAPTRLMHSGNLLTFSAFQAVLPDPGYGVALLLNSGSSVLGEQRAIFSGLLKIIEGTDSTPAGPRLHTSTIDVLLGCLTVAVLVLGARDIHRSRPWATTKAPYRVHPMWRLIPHLGVLALVVVFPKIAGHLVGGRDVNWLAGVRVARHRRLRAGGHGRISGQPDRHDEAAAAAAASDAARDKRASPRQNSVAMTFPYLADLPGRPTLAAPMLAVTSRTAPIRSQPSAQAPPTPPRHVG